MPIVLLKPGRHLKRQYEVTGWNRIVRLRLESTQPVDLALMDDVNYAEYRAGNDHDCYGPEGRRQSLDGKIRVGYRGIWNLVIQAMSSKKREPVHYRDGDVQAEEPIAVFYEVW